jgi:predicted kinase
MFSPLICFILIGPPGCGKTTLAQVIASHKPEYKIISLDQIKQESIGQSDRSTLKSKALQQIRAALQHQRPFIYDADNSKRAERLELLQELTQLQQKLDLNVYWVGLEIQVDRTKEKRKEDPILAEPDQFHPSTAEGFAKILQISPTVDESGQPDFQVIKIQTSSYQVSDPKTGRLTTKRKKTKVSISLYEFLDNVHICAEIKQSFTHLVNRNASFTFHAYSRLLDFERLMHLIALMINYPGIGHLQDTAPKKLQELLGTTQPPEFKTSLEEICGILAHQQGIVYADPEKISLDLQFLEHNSFFKSDPLTQQIEIPQVAGRSDQLAVSAHYASDRDVFERLIQTLRVLAHQPFLCSQLSGEELGGVQEILLAKIKTHTPLVASDSLRKDIQQIYKPYKILPNRAMRKGYFLGTGILASHELKEIYKVLHSQAKNLEDPVALGIYQTFESRMQESGILENSELAQFYPVRAIANRSIVDIDSLPEHGAYNNLQRLEAAIEGCKQLRLQRFPDTGRFMDDPLPEEYTVWPLQIVFHNIGWYLGFKTEVNKNQPLYQFARLDRLVWVQETGKTQSAKTARQSLAELEGLYQSGISLHIGKDPDVQQKFLDKKTRDSVMITIEIWCSEHIFRFIAEGTNRFPAGQVHMSKPVGSHPRNADKKLFSLKSTGDQAYPHRFQVKLPCWNLVDTDLRRWVVGFGDHMKVVSPPEMVESLQEFSAKLAAVYPDSIASTTAPSPTAK